MEDSLWTRDIEEDIIPLCRELGIGIVAYSPSWHWVLCWKGHCGKLAKGNPLVHASKVRRGELGEEQSALYTRLANLATKHGCTHPQLALAWLLHQGGDLVLIPGTTKFKNLDNNIRSVAVELTQEDMRGITDAVPISEVSGSKDPRMISLNIPGVLQMPPSKK